ncbi:hypothetical protein LTR17_008971 [Elasticomyces elasticus]|nr:hypothetical protein LTR17_008971 [Elasticomyces elasticus]
MAEAAKDHARLIEETQTSHDLAVAELEQKIKEIDLDFELENIGSSNPHEEFGASSWLSQAVEAYMSAEAFAG